MHSIFTSLDASFPYSYINSYIQFIFIYMNKHIVFCIIAVLSEIILICLFGDWITLLSIMVSSWHHFVLNGKVSFFMAA